VRRALEQAGLPSDSASSIELRSDSFWASGFAARDYAAPVHLHPLPRYHLRIVFRDPVAGPLALGAGRHCGLGLFAACA
jgi:CRISPR-associated protein Csb2